MDNERRKNFRCPIHEEGEPGILYRRRRKWPVRLTEKSVGGFRAVCRGQTKLSTDDKAVLETAVACYEVRIVHSHSEDDGTTMGLELLRECRPPNHSFGLAAALQTSALAIAVAVMAAAVGLAYSDTDGQLKEWLVSQFAENAEAPSRPGEPTADNRPANQGDGRLGPGLVRPAGLTTERFRRELRLTRIQEARISQVVGNAAAALTSISADASDSQVGWSDDGVHIIRQSWLRVQDVLTAEQLRRWEQLAAASSAPQANQQAAAR